MASRSHLHLNHLDDFKAFLDARGIQHRPGRGDYQHLQVEHKGGWQAIFARNGAKEHFSVPEPFRGLVAAFYRERKAN